MMPSEGAYNLDQKRTQCYDQCELKAITLSSFRWFLGKYFTFV